MPVNVHPAFLESRRILTECTRNTVRTAQMSAHATTDRLGLAGQVGYDRHPVDLSEQPVHQAALVYSSLGYRCIPLLAGKKAPSIGWKRYQVEAPTPSDYDSWFRDTRHNIGILTGSIVVMDCDSPESIDFVMEQCGPTPAVCRTPRGGFHLYYRKRKGVIVGNQVRVRGRPVDVRAEGAYVVAPPSVNEQGRPYAWLGELLPAKELPVCKIGWLRARRRKPVQPVENIGHMQRRARAYIAHIEGALAGQRGHDRTFRVACVLVQKFGLSIEESWPLFLEWNQQCEPPWTEKELLHKLQDAYRLRFRNSTRGAAKERDVREG
ncbi:MAG: bifunctional DNA primase/polymerase [Gemmataceae bacterium]